MILERLEPKNSKKVAVGVPGRPFEVAKGGFSTPGFGILAGKSIILVEKNVTLVEKSGSERNDLLNSSELQRGTHAGAAVLVTRYCLGVV